MRIITACGQTAHPLGHLLMLSLTGMYMALANSMGVVSYLSDLLQNTIPAHWILPGVVLVMCVLSLFRLRRLWWFP